MTTYRLPDVLGGSEVEVLHGFAREDSRIDVKVPGFGVITVSSTRVLVVVPPPLPEEPPVASFVHLASYYGVYERVERGWLATSEAGGKAYDWETLVRLNSGDAPVRLIPAPEPVALPWSYDDEHSNSSVAIEPAGNPYMVEIAVKEDGDGTTYVYVPGAQLLRAVWAAAAEAEATS